MNSTPTHSQQITQSSGSNFVSSFWFLPEEKRQALTAIYAFCRITDDIVDQANGDASTQEARGKLQNWMKETSRAFQNKSSHPVLAELVPVAEKYRIPPTYFHELIEGVQMDLDTRTYSTFDDLHPYCYKVAGVVGLICLEVFGYKNVKSKDYAVNLGIAFQLTNILRDIRTDAQRGRVYIPLEDLAECDLTAEDVLSIDHVSGKKAKQFNRLVELECDRAEHYYKRAKSNLSWEDRSNMIAAEVMSSVYHALLKKIRRDPTSVLRSKIKLSKTELSLRVLQGWLRNKLRI